MGWRKITAEQYFKNDDEDGFDEAFIRCPLTGRRIEIWDVGREADSGQIAIYTAAAEPIMVGPTYPIEVR